MIFFCYVYFSFLFVFFFFLKKKTAYELRISDWSSDVGSSDLKGKAGPPPTASPAASASAPMRWNGQTRSSARNGSPPSCAPAMITPPPAAGPTPRRARCRKRRDEGQEPGQKARRAPAKAGAQFGGCIKTVRTDWAPAFAGARCFSS